MQKYKVLGFLAGIGNLYKARYLAPAWACHQEHEHDPWDSLAVFLEGYAFERQGRRPDFSHVAAEVMEELRSGGFKLDTAASPRRAWQRFCERLGGRGLNSGLNPLCPNGTAYATQRRQNCTHQPSAVEVAAELWQDGQGVTLTQFVRFGLQQSTVLQAWNALARVNGVGSKIVAFFLRDVALHYAIDVTDRRELLQPIDIHVRRISQSLRGDDNAADDSIASWINSASRYAGVCPELVNAGMWYFGSQVGGSKYWTLRILENLPLGQELVDRHVETLHAAHSAWSQRA